MIEKTNNIKGLFEQKLNESKALADIEQLRIEFLGKKGSVQELMQDLRNVPNDKKREMGQAINTLKQFIEKAIEEKQEELQKLEWQNKIDNTQSYD